MNFHFPPQLTFGWLPIAYLLTTAIVHVGFAATVGQDAVSLRREGSGPLIAGPFLWTLATLLGGVFVAGLYWLVNHSSLSRR